MTSAFEDLLESNLRYSAAFRPSAEELSGVARAGVAIVTCMDSRIEPLQMLGLGLGDAKILRTPGARLTDDALIGCVLGVNLLGVTRILIVQHTKCAMSAGDDSVRARIAEKTGTDTTDLRIGAFTDQRAVLEGDVALLRAESLVTRGAEIGGFLYDVDTGALTQLF